MRCTSCSDSRELNRTEEACRDYQSNAAGRNGNGRRSDLLATRLVTRGKALISRRVMRNDARAAAAVGLAVAAETNAIASRYDCCRWQFRS